MAVGWKVKNNSGSILILALWILTLLSIFSVQVGMKVRQRVLLLSRIEHRSQLHYLAEAGVKKAIAALKLDLARNRQIYSAQGKQFRHNNPERFHRILLGDGYFDVSYEYHDGAALPVQTRYGFIDEERKINLNSIDPVVLTRLIQRVVTSDQQEAQSLVDAIIDWREPGNSKRELTGYYSEDFYSNLQYPYPVKHKFFEVIDELLLVKGIDLKVFKALSPFVTVYGDGLININTALREVLISLGVSDALVDKILLIRRGADGVDDTPDDFVFQNTYDIASDLKQYINLEDNEVKQIDFLNNAGILKTNSFYYTIGSSAHLEGKEETLRVQCVYNARQNMIDFWKEK